MPRIVPSQVVDQIERIFPLSTRAHALGKSNAGQLLALVNLVDAIPAELLMMDSNSQAGFVCGVAQIRHTLDKWSADRNDQSYLGGIPGFPDETAVTLIRKALAQCPDAAPESSTAELNFIKEEDLRTNLRIDIGAIDRELTNGEWKAATILAGSAAEALLLWALQVRQKSAPAEVEKAIKDAPTLPSKPLEKWDLYSYIEAARRLKIITESTATQAQLARNFRDLIHPGRVQRLSQKCDKATAHSAFAGVLHVIRDITPQQIASATAVLFVLQNAAQCCSVLLSLN
jgi:hypothetical protein